MKAFSRAGYVRRKKNYEEGKNFFGEQIILFAQGKLQKKEKRAFIVKLRTVKVKL